MHAYKALGILFRISILTPHSLISFYPLAILALTMNFSQIISTAVSRLGHYSSFYLDYGNSLLTGVPLQVPGLVQSQYNIVYSQHSYSVKMKVKSLLCPKLSSGSILLSKSQRSCSSLETLWIQPLLSLSSCPYLSPFAYSSLVILFSLLM